MHEQSPYYKMDMVRGGIQKWNWKSMIISQKNEWQRWQCDYRMLAPIFHTLNLGVKCRFFSPSDIHLCDKACPSFTCLRILGQNPKKFTLCCFQIFFERLKHKAMNIQVLLKILYFHKCGSCLLFEIANLIFLSLGFPYFLVIVWAHHLLPRITFCNP